MAGTFAYSWCRHCGGGFEWVRARAGDAAQRLYCSSACKQGAYRERQRVTREQREREERFRREEWERAQRQRDRERRERQEREREQRRQRERASSGGGGGRYRSSGRRDGMTSSEARRVVFEMAGLVDDGTVTLKKAYRAAARRHHPDAGGDSEAFKYLEEAASVLRRRGHL
ncbi:hypothetical protein I5Q34_34105 [Streptomyces sp. AV19]|uniref:hypothetical protein n=1 Tax=Streptomyces sp. AV19 TaxID=2793068 RepID=UPI0018FED01D|nr:hypothetical protein [Streptomyces sp. AV19]MBH1939235.1 hypothetical protein [Streptomyces sp. AV19]MDG4537183.1 hypothetical protein [Streptomyces sp. AV19]